MLLKSQLASEKHANQEGRANRLDDGTWTRKAGTALNYGPKTKRKKNNSDSSKDVHLCITKQLLRVEEYFPGTVPPSMCFSLSCLVNYSKVTPLEYDFYLVGKIMQG